MDDSDILQTFETLTRGLDQAPDQDIVDELIKTSPQLVLHCLERIGEGLSDEDVYSGEDQLVGAYLQLAEAGQPAKRRVAAKPLEGKRQLWAEALNTISLREVKNLPEVRAFWKHVKKVPADKVEDWILAQAQKDGGGATLWMRVPQGPGGEPMAWSKAKDIPGAAIEGERIAYLVGDEVREKAVSVDGVLGALKTLAAMLSARYGWPDYWVVGYLLTRDPPPEAGLMVRMRRETVPEMPAAQRITLDVNPNMPPPLLQKHYSRLRSRVVPFERLRVSERDARLAELTAAHEHETIDERWSRWKKKYRRKDWTFRSRGKFAKASRDAFHKITGRELEEDSNG